MLLAPTGSDSIREEFQEASLSPDRWVNLIGISEGRIYFEIGNRDSVVSNFGLGFSREVRWVPLEPPSGENRDSNFYFTKKELESLAMGNIPWVKDEK